jgi:monothiol glutaredoxin
MDVVETIKDQLGSHPIVLYMKGSPDFPQCGFSSQTVQAMKDCGVQFMFIKILEEPEVREALKEYSNWPTYPQLYLKGELVGGCDIIMDHHSKGELERMLKGAVKMVLD